MSSPAHITISLYWPRPGGLFFIDQRDRLGPFDHKVSTTGSKRARQQPIPGLPLITVGTQPLHNCQHIVPTTASVSGVWKLPSEDRVGCGHMGHCACPHPGGPGQGSQPFSSVPDVGWLGARPMAYSQPCSHTHGLWRCTTRLALENNVHVSSSSAEFPMH